MKTQDLLETNTIAHASEPMAARENKNFSFKLQVVKNTILKSKPLQSDELSVNEKHNLKAGTKLKLVSYKVEDKHLKIITSEALFDNVKTWYIFGEHVEVFKGNSKVYPDPDKIQLPVPYKSQLDNLEDPSGSCNVTSIAMCLEYLKVTRHKSSGQFEDELYEYALNQGLNPKAPLDLAQIVQDYGAKDTFTFKGTIAEVKDWLAKGNPVVIHGYFTPVGHIIVLVGYDSTGFIVHDPNGEWFSGGYDRNQPDGNNQKGKFLHYSYKMIKQTSMADGDFWVHFISR